MNDKYVEFFKWVALELTKWILCFSGGAFILSLFIGKYYDRGIALCILLPLSGFLMVFCGWMHKELDYRGWYIYTLVITVIYCVLGSFIIPTRIIMVLFPLLEVVVLLLCYINCWICAYDRCTVLIFIGGIIVVIFLIASIVGYLDHGGVKDLKDFFCRIGAGVGGLVAWGGKSSEEEYETDYFRIKDYESIAPRVTLIYVFFTLSALIIRIILKV